MRIFSYIYIVKDKRYRGRPPQAMGFARYQEVRILTPSAFSSKNKGYEVFR